MKSQNLPRPTMAVSSDTLPVTNVSRETLENVIQCYDSQEEIFRELITKWFWWNRSVNLFSRSTTEKQLKLHILHSLLLFFEDRSADREYIIDVGTGGGLPGLPMAIMDPGTNYLLVDKVYKKYAALKNIVHSLDLKNIQPLCEDIGNLHRDDNVRIVSKHAFHIPELMNKLRHCSWVEISLLKGEDLYQELTPEIIQNYDVDVRKIQFADPFFQNKYIVSIRAKTDS